jgi:hypothetical protein
MYIDEGKINLLTPNKKMFLFFYVGSNFEAFLTKLILNIEYQSCNQCYQFR